MPAPLHTRVVVVSGAGGRLAGTLLRALVAEGATLAAIARPGSSHALPEGAQGAVFHADTSAEADVRRVFAEVRERLGPIYALVHTVGSWDGRPFLDTTLAQWEAQLSANLTSAFLCFREAIRVMEEDGGRLVAIASGQGADRGVAQQAAYSAAKAGVVRLVESVAEEFEGQGICAYALAPSSILYEGAKGPGVAAEDLAKLGVDLLKPAARAMTGTVLRAYGPRSLGAG
jgi:3-oxoacyl-[acyl-carrier protein] reductase